MDKYMKLKREVEGVYHMERVEIIRLIIVYTEIIPNEAYRGRRRFASKNPISLVLRHLVATGWVLLLVFSFWERMR